MNTFFFKYGVDVMKKRSARASNNKRVPNYEMYVKLGRNFSFYWFLNAERLVHTNKFLSAHGFEG